MDRPRGVVPAMGVFISIPRDIFKNTLLVVVSSLNLVSVNKVAKLFQTSRRARQRRAPKRMALARPNVNKGKLNVLEKFQVKRW